MPLRTHAFALLGPYAPWMTTNLNYRIDWYAAPQLPLGGPMPIGEGYRWNVPVLTYGFDQSFLQYFGPAGVTAVQNAIKIINDLPSASTIVLTNYPSNSTRFSILASQEYYVDLSSVALSALMSELGLAPPTANVWTLRQWDSNAFQISYYYENGFLYFPWTDFFVTNGYILERNYSPNTDLPSPYVNNMLFDFEVISTPDASFAFTKPELANPTAPTFTAVCDSWACLGNPGLYYTGLTRDDVGGLAYLLNQTNIWVESLDEFCFPTLRNTNGLVLTAPRPGVEKISFIPHPTDLSGNFLTLSNRFTDIFYTNGLPATQTVMRVTSRPDFVFTARDLGGIYYTQYQVFQSPLPCQPQDTSNWINNSVLNGSADGMGPGNIHGPIEIVFHTPGKYIAAVGGTLNSTSGQLWNWGSFTNSQTNIIVYPGNQTNLTSLTMALFVQTNSVPPSFEWDVLGRTNSVYLIDTSTNLLDWNPVTSITNTNGIFIFTYPFDQPRRFFRATLQ